MPMGNLHAYVDESIRRDYMTCAAILPPTELSAVRRQIKDLRVSGSDRVHMAKDSRHAPRIVPAFAELPVAVRLYVAKLGGVPERQARDRSLAAMVPDLVQNGVGRLCLESCDQDKQDRQCIRSALVEEFGNPQQLEYTHRTPSAEPLLWASDVFAWAWGQGGRYRDMLDRVNLSVVHVNMP